MTLPTKWLLVVGVLSWGFFCEALTASTSAQPNPQVTGYTDVDHQGSAYRSVVIYAQDVPLDIRQEIEERVVETLRESTLSAEKAIEMIPPTRTTNGQYVSDVLRKSGLQSTLTLTTYQISFEIEQEEIRVRRGSTSRELDTISGKFVEMPGKPKVTGGRVKTLPSGIFTATLTDNETGSTIWSGSIRVSGRDIRDLAIRAFTETISHLRSAGILAG
jgi:hypothetical protein